MFGAFADYDFVEGFNPLLDLGEEVRLNGNFCFCAHRENPPARNISVYRAQGTELRGQGAESRFDWFPLELHQI
ncbi:hypothetical protein GCM10011586_11300 [Silvibacterium dinghuense]|nr:hypothetical protein GCM10011586_11300 [Silvibacterium dinghuense]